MNTGKTTVILLFGGQSAEHEVSVRSAQCVSKALDASRYHVVPIGITKRGAWVQGPAVARLLQKGSVVSRTGALSAPLQPQPGWSGQLIHGIKSRGSVVVFPMLHGTLGEDGTVQGLLELTGLPYVGCGVLASAVGMDKAVGKDLFMKHGIPVMKYVVIKSGMWKTEKDGVVKHIEMSFSGRYPCFVKPANAGSSIGVSKAVNRRELIDAIDTAFLYDQKVLVEEGWHPVREMEVGILGDENPEVSVAGEIVPNGEFYDYDAKYRKESTLLIPADIPKETLHRIQAYAKDAFMAMDGYGMARADFFLDKETGDVWLSELNTIPGFTDVSMYPKLWEASGIPYPSLIDRLIELAIVRRKQQDHIRRDYGH